ncbi:MAG: Maf family protein [Chitinophagaceae bacterium]|nr:Maf family protein [Chitinophagaceae bacterium]
MQQIILASQSPRRKMLLEWAEIPFEIMVVPTAESFSMQMPVAEIPIHIAKQKITATVSKINETKGDAEKRLILAADTIVVLENEVLNKPTNKHEAITMLTKLAGKEHQVITGVVIYDPVAKTEHQFAETTSVRFHPLNTEQIIHYVDVYQPYDKAGAYAIQEWIGVVGIAGISGDFYNVMGLPISRVVQLLHTIKS